MPTDVTDEAAVAELARCAVQRFGRSDVWVNNASVYCHVGAPWLTAYVSSKFAVRGSSYGMLGGVYRRQALLPKAIEAYTSGREVEQDEQYDIIDSYNLTNSVVLPVVVEPTRLDADLPEIRRAADVLKGQVQGKRRDQWWAWADLGLLALLSEQQEVADDAYRQFRRNGARASDFDSTIAVIQECQEALQRAHPAVAERLQTTIATLRANMPEA